MVDPTFYLNSYTGDPEPRQTKAPMDLTAPATWDIPNWLVSRDMKVVNPTAVAAGIDSVRNTDLAKLLTDRAKAVRNDANMLFDSKANRLANGSLYVEWGESIYLALWNL